MTPNESITADRERQLDAIVLAYLKESEENPSLDQQAWIERHPELKVELAAFFRDKEQIDRLAKLLRSLTDATVESRQTSDATVAWEAAGASVTTAGSKPLQMLGNYELLDELGKGGMGVVYKARQQSLKRIVALKMILAGVHADKEQMARFRSEAEAVARLQHPNIVQIYEVGEIDHCPFFSLEFVEGGSLAAQLNGTPMPPRAAAQMVRTLAQAIHFAHEQGIIHRDLKPANILLSAASTPGANAAKKQDSSSRSTNRGPLTQVPKITDFGLAKRLDDDSGQTKEGSILGTPSYMAPEQAAGQAHQVGPASDIYGLGAILYEMLSGRPPFKAATPWETVNQVLRNEPVSPRMLEPNVDRDLETICLKCLQKNPQRRYESAEALADDLQRYLEGRPILARPILNTVKFWRLCRRHPGTAISLAMVLASLLALLVVIAIFNHRLKEDNRELQMTLTKQVANRIDNDLLQFKRIPTLMAATLSLRSDWTKEQLDSWMREMLAKDERLFGTAVAYEPKHFDGKQHDFAKYAYRSKEGVDTKMLHPNYKPPYRESNWYEPIKIKESARWTEPFVDHVEGGNIPMLTYSVPIWRNKQFAGVATVDLSIAYFDAMRQWLDELNLGNQGYAFLVSPTGTFISHPDPKFQMPRKITDAPEFQATESLQGLTERILSGEAGTMRAVDPSSGRPSVFYFAPIRSAQWSFVVVIEE